jgi:hypothetical protein
MLGIPTTYHGVRFRSRLEARWAAFFDLLQWSWCYEPFDLDGWIPDFALKADRPILVEVKPYFSLSQFIERPRYEHAMNASDYVTNELLLLGADLVEQDEGLHKRSDDDVCIGWLGERWIKPAHPIDRCFELAHLMQHQGRWGFGHAQGSWCSRFAIQCVDKEVAREEPNPCDCWSYPNKLLCDADDAYAFWRAAGNLVQWQSVRRVDA